MFKKLLALLIICTYCSISYAKKINIITSISPLAAITAMIGQDKVEITTLANQSQCPHHYFLKPEQFLQLKKADLVIYLDDSFEFFMQKPLTISSASILKLSASAMLDNTVNGLTNWHLCYDINNIKLIMSSILAKLSLVDSKNKNFYTKNYNNALKNLDTLKQQMQTILATSSTFILLDDSLHYLFSNFTSNQQLQIINLTSDNMNFEGLKKIKQQIKTTKNKCVFISEHQNIHKIQKLFGRKIKVISIDVESWDNGENLPDSFSKQINKTIELIKPCL